MSKFISFTDVEDCLKVYLRADLVESIEVLPNGCRINYKGMDERGDGWYYDAEESALSIVHLIDTVLAGER